MNWILVVIIIRTGFVVSGGLPGEPIIVDQSTRVFASKSDCYESIDNTSVSSSIPAAAINYNYAPLASDAVNSNPQRFGHVMYCYPEPVK